ncbi:glycoside hydrolase family 78 protein [Coniophora puteana RWD-64-598 SS2]|uniref:Glycoside hydrolase family 78 protein n=1 Tax=Coniophora puteana (strain RWD-64-598) TaxID=741705 RepID=A0A5M3M7T4_CONPW|nr:glycoside hydrolase family 78 protein [Coniophora puteana RWD-64-598 SS2]EIW74840.1 glycoside hydrolase family 78 protein [Coniophora puteana RWD-64-598 SS2]
MTKSDDDVLGAAPSGPWDAFNLAPTSRTVYPTSVYKSEGLVLNAEGLTSSPESEAAVGNATLNGNGAWVALDFGKEVGGWVSLNFENVSSTSSISLAFTESPLFIRPDASDDSSYPDATTKYDGVMNVTAPISEGYWTQPRYMLRGGYRYLTIVSHDDAPVTISNVSCEISFSPATENMTEYAGYFYAKDPESEDSDFLTKLWYAGGYTVQTNVVPLDTGRQVPFVSSGWANNATLGVAGPIIVDGAKRDRAVWPGDMGIAVPSAFVTTNDLVPPRNALSTMFAAQDPTTGALPESGPPLSQTGSDTYLMWTLIGTYNYYLYTGDTEWFSTVWTNYTRAVAYIESKVDDTGLLNVTGLRDWGRFGQGGHNAEANAILYRLLITSTALATYINDTSLASAYSSNASALKSTFNNAFWLVDAGLYRDNETTLLTPQDANSFAVLFNLTQSAAQAQTISANLKKNWVALGPVAPELPDTISPFISGFELQAHFAAGNDATAMDLLRREWGYMLYTNVSVQSTLLEGFTTNGSLYYRSQDGYNYDPAYTSHSHGWSTGPTSALTFYVLGLTLTAPQGTTWSVAPHFSGLPAAQGGFETPLGAFGVQWTMAGDGRSVSIVVRTPEGTSGTVAVANATAAVVDGRSVQGNVGLLELQGGTHNVTLQL